MPGSLLAVRCVLKLSDIPTAKDRLFLQPYTPNTHAGNLCKKLVQNDLRTKACHSMMPVSCESFFSCASFLSVCYKIAL